MSKYFISLFIFVFIFFAGCTENSTQDETYFIKQVQQQLKTTDKIETDFTDLVRFEWDEVCFTEGNAPLLKFSNTKMNTKYNITLPENYTVREGYVKNSPIQEYYRSGKLTKKNCWGKGTKFIIKKWNTHTQNHLLIEIKGK